MNQQATTFPRQSQEPTEADYALDTFRSLFPYTFPRVFVSLDGLTMHMYLARHGAGSVQYLAKMERIARRVIRDSRLPLEAHSRVLQQGDYIYSLSLEINYLTSKTEPICY